MKQKEFIYHLVANGTVLYIGRTKNLKKRLSQHLRESLTGNTKKCVRIRELVDAGIDIEIVPVLEVDVGELGSAEDDAISNFFCKTNGELLNSRGGDTGLLSPREQAELSKKITYWKQQAKTKKKIKKAADAGFVKCRDCECTMLCKKQAESAAEAFAAYERGELTLEDLKTFSER